MIPLVALISAALSRRVANAPDWKGSSAIVHLFRDFWFYAAVFGLSDSSLGWPDSLQRNIQNIARYSPILTFDENEPMKQSLQMNPALKATPTSSKDMEELKQGLIAAIGAGNIDLERNVATMDYPHLIYHLGPL